MYVCLLQEKKNKVVLLNFELCNDCLCSNVEMATRASSHHEVTHLNTWIYGSTSYLRLGGHVHKLKQTLYSLYYRKRILIRPSMYWYDATLPTSGHVINPQGYNRHFSLLCFTNLYELFGRSKKQNSPIKREGKREKWEWWAWAA